MSAYCPGFIQTHLDHSEEYKQDKYKIEDPYYGSKYHQAMQGAAAYFIKTGRAIDESGPIVFKAIEDDQLYIITHEHYDKYIQLRCEKMLARKNPELIPIDHNIQQ